MEISKWCNKLHEAFNTILSYSKAEDCLLYAGRFDYIVDHLEELYAVTNLLADEKSQETFLKVILYNLSTAFFDESTQKKLFSLFSEEQWNIFTEKASKSEFSQIKGIYLLDIVETWLLEGYAYTDICEALPRDVVVDGGAHTGNTAFYFQKKVGSKGKVYSFEPSPKTFTTLKQNICEARLSNVFPVHSALSDFDGETVFSNDNSPGSSIFLEGHGTVNVPVTTIDNFFFTKKIEKVDFIKLDVERAESAAITGAKRVIQEHHPRMAICIYHRMEDLVDIPKLILEINPYYEFYVKHNSDILYETVLFCKPVDYKNEFRPVPEEKARSIVLLRDSFINLKNNYTQKKRKKYFDDFFEIAASDEIFKKNFICESSYNFACLSFSTIQTIICSIRFIKNNVHLSISLGDFSSYLEDQHKKFFIDFFQTLQANIPSSLEPLIQVDGELSFSITVKNFFEKDNSLYTAYLFKYLLNQSLPFFWKLGFLKDDFLIYALKTFTQKN